MADYDDCSVEVFDSLLENVNVVLGAGADVVATDFSEEFCKGVSSKSNPKSICWLIGDCWCADAETGLI